MFVGNYECVVSDGKLKLPKAYEYGHDLYCVCYESEGAMILSFSNTKDDQCDFIREIPLFERKITVRDGWLALPKEFLDYASGQQIMFAGVNTRFEILTKEALESLVPEDNMNQEIMRRIDDILG